MARFLVGLVAVSLVVVCAWIMNTTDGQVFPQNKEVRIILAILGGLIALCIAAMVWL